MAVVLTIDGGGEEGRGRGKNRRWINSARFVTGRRRAYVNDLMGKSRVGGYSTPYKVMRELSFRFTTT